MEETNKEPAIPWLIIIWKERKLKKKQRDIEELKLDIEKTRLEKQLKWAKS